MGKLSDNVELTGLQGNGMFHYNLYKKLEDELPPDHSL